jgi:hypothetical protein
MAKFKSECSSSWSVYSNKITKGKILPTAYPLRLATIAGSYKDLLYLDNNNLGITSSFKNIYDGDGKALKIKTSNSKFEINTDGGYISDPIIGSSLSYLYKVELSETAIVYEVNSTASCNIMFYYFAIGSAVEKTYNVNISVDDLFLNSEFSNDEFISSEFKFNIFNYSNAIVTVNISFTYQSINTEVPIIISSSGNNSVNIFSTSAFVCLYKFPTLKIESVEIPNA